MHTQRNTSNAWLRRFVAHFRGAGGMYVALLFALAFVVTGCGGDHHTATNEILTALGIVDPPRPAPEWITFICDGSDQSTCDAGAADEQIQLIARYTIARPGTHFEVQLLGPSASESIVLGRIDAPESSVRGRSALRAQEERFLAAVRTQVCRPVERELRRTRPRRSEIAEAITRATLVPTNGRLRRIVVMSDLREYSDLLDAECRPLPTRAEWLAKLRRRHLLPAGSLAGARVHFARAFGGPATGRGCSWSVARDLALRELWGTAVQAAGAAEVTFSSEVIDLAQHTNEPASPTRTTDGGTR